MLLKISLWNWHIFYNLTSPHDELPLHQRKENNNLMNVRESIGIGWLNQMKGMEYFMEFR